MSEEYSDRLERAAAEGYSARDCRDFAGKGVRLSMPYVCLSCWKMEDECICTDAPSLGSGAPQTRPDAQTDPDQQAGPCAQSLALPEGEWPDMFELRLSFGMFVMSPALFKKKAQTAFMLLGAEASKRGYLFEMYEDKETLDRCFRFTRPAQSSGDSGGEQPCPACGSLETDKLHHQGSFALPECVYRVCESCGHQWDHQ